jgi:hypothetical protein
LGALVEAHSHIDWPTLLVGIIIGIPISYVIGMVAILHAPRFVQFLDRRKLLRKTKTKKQALMVFTRIKSFREGTRDRYPFYIILASSAIMCALLASTLLLVLLIQAGGLNSVSLEDISFGDVIVAILAFFAIFFAVILLLAIYETARQIERFEAYKVEFETQWGSVDSSE